MMKPDPVRLSIAWQDPALVQIGKAGLSEGLLKEITRLIKKHKYIKIRLLRSALDTASSKQEVLEIVCQRVNAQLAGIRGNTAVIYKTRARSKGVSRCHSCSMVILLWEILTVLPAF